MKLLAAFIVLFWLSVIVALVARRPRPVIAEPWDEEPDGVQPVDPRLTNWPLYSPVAMRYGVGTGGNADVALWPAGRPTYTDAAATGGADNYAHWQAEYARHQAAIGQ